MFFRSRLQCYNTKVNKQASIAVLWETSAEIHIRPFHAQQAFEGNCQGVRQPLREFMEGLDVRAFGVLVCSLSIICEDLEGPGVAEGAAVDVGAG